MLQGIRTWLEERYEIERVCIGKSQQRTNFGGPTPGYTTTYCDRRLNSVNTRKLCAKLCQPRHYLKLVQSALRLAKKTGLAKNFNEQERGNRPPRISNVRGSA